MALTYEPIATTTLGSNASTVTLSSIPATYTDLILISNILAATGGTSDYTLYMRLNGDTATNYSDTILRGDGSTATSSRHSNIGSIVLQSTGYLSSTVPLTTIIQINNYANTTTNKTVLSRANQADTVTNATVGLWRKTPEAINSVTLFLDTGNMKSGSTFTLYGIKAA